MKKKNPLSEWKPNMKNIGKPMNLKNLDFAELNLMMHVSRDQGDLKEMARIKAEWNRRNK